MPLNVLTFQMAVYTSAKRMLELGLSENFSFQAMGICERTDKMFRKNEFRVSILSEKVVFFKQYDVFW